MIFYYIDLNKEFEYSIMEYQEFIESADISSIKEFGHKIVRYGTHPHILRWDNGIKTHIHIQRVKIGMNTTDIYPLFSYPGTTTLLSAHLYFINDNLFFNFHNASLFELWLIKEKIDFFLILSPSVLL